MPPVSRSRIMAYCSECNAKTGVFDIRCNACGYDFTASSDSDEEFIGDCTKRRYLAAIIDNFGAIVASLLIAFQLPLAGQAVKGLSVYALYLLYFFVAEAYFGTTVGKWYFGLSVVGIDGKRCSTRQAGVRTLLRIIEVNPVLFGAIPAAILILFTHRKQRLGGILTNTVVRHAD